jgi:hypothetical protein
MLSFVTDQKEFGREKHVACSSRPSWGLGWDMRGSQILSVTVLRQTAEIFFELIHKP